MIEAVTVCDRGGNRGPWRSRLHAHRVEAAAVTVAGGWRGSRCLRSSLDSGQAKELAGAVLTMGLRTYYGPTYLLWAYYGPTYLLWAYYRPYLLWACVLTRRYFVWLHLVWLHLVWLHLVWLPEELVGAKLDPLEG